MKIGIYKIGKPIYFKQNEEDHASWSIEVTNIMRILHDKGHELFILSETDYDGTEYKTHVVSNLDRIYVWNGFEQDKHWLDVFKLCADVRLIVTDLALIPKEQHLFEQIYWQAPSTGKYEYGAIETAALQSDFKIGHHQRDIKFYFGGTERNRTADFLEYVYRPEHIWHGKSESLNIRNYIPFDEHIKLLEQTRYTIVIGDKKYNQVGFVTPRYYECLLHGVIPFVDCKFDSDELIPVHPYLFVSSFIEMNNKMNELDADPERRMQIFREAIDLIPHEYWSGQYLYDKIIK